MVLVIFVNVFLGYDILFKQFIGIWDLGDHSSRASCFVLCL